MYVVALQIARPTMLMSLTKDEGLRSRQMMGEEWPGRKVLNDKKNERRWLKRSYWKDGGQQEYLD